MLLFPPISFNHLTIFLVSLYVSLTYPIIVGGGIKSRNWNVYWGLWYEYLLVQDSKSSNLGDRTLSMLNIDMKTKGIRVEWF